MQKQQFTGQIKIQVDAPELVGGTTKHHSYRIHGSDDIGQIDVWRRYSDFILLKQSLATRWPGIYVPSLPEKKFIGNNQADFLIVRRQGIQNFLKLISDEKYLWYSDEFQLFIKSKTAQVEKLLSNLGKTNNRQISSKYRTKFSTILQASDQDRSLKQYDVKVAEFRAYLKNTLVLLEKMSKVSEVMADSRKRFNQRYDHLLTNILPSYEQKCTTAYVDEHQNLYFLNSKTNGLAQVQINLSLNSKENSLNIVNEMIKQEVRQISNFQQILKIRQQFQVAKLKALSKTKDLQLEQTKISVGKESLINKIKNATREQQIQQNKLQLAKARQDYKEAEQVCKVIDTMLALDQIPKFKSIRSKNYYHIVKEMAKAEKKNLELEQQFWSKISGDRFIVQDFSMQNSQGSHITMIGGIQVIHHQNENQHQQHTKTKKQQKQHEQRHEEKHQHKQQSAQQLKVQKQDQTHVQNERKASIGEQSL